mgnify:CR=1 FL=1|tara:strand:- start:3650 stop:5224 length:1575 start_codon:yes stop_codon:yes gene_type:complete
MAENIHHKYAKLLLNALIKSNEIMLDFRNITYTQLLNKFKDLISSCILIEEFIKLEQISNLTNELINDAHVRFKNKNHKCKICDILLRIHSKELIKEILNMFKMYYKELYESKKALLNQEKELYMLETSISLMQYFSEYLDTNTLSILSKFLNSKKDNDSKSFISLLEDCSFIKKFAKSKIISQNEFNIFKNMVKAQKDPTCLICKLLNYIFSNYNLGDKAVHELFKIYDIEISNTFEILLNIDSQTNKQIEKRVFTIFKVTKNASDYKSIQWINLFEDMKIFRKFKENKFFVKLIGITRYFMLPMMYYKDNPNDYSIKNYDALCNMSIKEWNKYCKKHIDQFFTMESVKKNLIDISEYKDYYKNQIELFRESCYLKDYNRNEYLFNIDLNNNLECFIYSHKKVNEDCKDLLQIFYTLNEINNHDKLKRYILCNKKMQFLNDIVGNIIREWINTYKCRDSILSNISENYNGHTIEYDLSYLYKLDTIPYEILETNISIQTELDISDDEEYSPETVQRLIDEMKM